MVELFGVEDYTPPEQSAQQKSANDHIWITNTEELGIESPLAKVELKFAVYEGDDLENPTVSDVITIE